MRQMSEFKWGHRCEKNVMVILKLQFFQNCVYFILKTNGECYVTTYILFKVTLKVSTIC